MRFKTSWSKEMHNQKNLVGDFFLTKGKFSKLIIPCLRNDFNSPCEWVIYGAYSYLSIRVCLCA